MILMELQLLQSNLAIVMSEVQFFHEMVKRVEFLDHTVILIFLFLHRVAARIFC